MNNQPLVSDAQMVEEIDQLKYRLKIGQKGRVRERSRILVRFEHMLNGIIRAFKLDSDPHNFAVLQEAEHGQEAEQGPEEGREDSRGVQERETEVLVRPEGDQEEAGGGHRPEPEGQGRQEVPEEVKKALKALTEAESEWVCSQDSTGGCDGSWTMDLEGKRRCSACGGEMLEGEFLLVDSDEVDLGAIDNFLRSL